MIDSQVYRWFRAIKEDDTLHDVASIIAHEGDDREEIVKRFCELFAEYHPVCVDDDEREEKVCTRCPLPGDKYNCKGLASKGDVEAVCEWLDSRLEDFA